MTDEAAFHLYFDAHRFDFTALGAFADWLQDRDDDRAEGYRAMGALHKAPAHWPLDQWISPRVCWYDAAFAVDRDTPDDPESDLPEPWFKRLVLGGAPGADRRQYVGEQVRPLVWDVPAALVLARDDAARAFLALTPHVRERLVRGAAW